MTWCLGKFPFFPKFLESDIEPLLSARPEHAVIDAICAAAIYLVPTGDLSGKDRIKLAQLFASRAKRIIMELTTTATSQYGPDLDLNYVKASLLLDIYDLFCSGDVSEWPGMKTTIQLAGNLGLKDMEFGTHDNVTASYREDCREVWWSICELDGFCGLIFKHSISTRLEKMHTCLPLATIHSNFASSASLFKSEALTSQDWFQAEPTLSVDTNVESPFRKINDKDLYRMVVYLGHQVSEALNNFLSYSDMHRKILSLEDNITAFKLDLPLKYRRSYIPMPYDDHPKCRGYVCTQLSILLHL